MKNSKVLSILNNGLLAWIYQRLSAILIGLYITYISYILLNNSSDYNTIQKITQTIFFKYFTLLTIICIVIHSWIGIYNIIDDYIKNKMLDFILSSITLLYLISILIISGFILF